MSEETKKTPKTISRREFLKDAGIVVGGTAVGSAFFLSACGKEVEVTKTVTTTALGTTSTKTVTTTAGGSTQTVTKYTCPVCSQEFNSLGALKDHFDTEHDLSSGSANLIKLTVNGRLYELNVEPRWSLQKTLQEKLGFMSIKTMCGGLGQCGSCSVIVNGKPILSCMALAIECDGAEIETAEGFAEAEHPIVQAYIKNHCMQCGYCTPGFIVTAKALLDHNPNPTKEEIIEALGGNICRCGTYPAHIIAVQEAASKL